MPNAKVLSEKQAIVAALTERIQNASSGLFVDYKGINVAQDVVASKLTTGLNGKFVGTKALTREEACLYAFNSLKAMRAYYPTKADKITIGNIMLLIPGISFTTSLRDIINGDTISGLVGISEAVIKAIAIAIGFAMVLVGMGGIL